MAKKPPEKTPTVSMQVLDKKPKILTVKEIRAQIRGLAPCAVACLAKILKPETLASEKDQIAAAKIVLELGFPDLKSIEAEDIENGKQAILVQFGGEKGAS